MAPVVALVLAVAALLAIAVSPAFYQIGLALAVAGLLVGGASAYNARADRLNLVLAGVAVFAALVGLVWTLALIA